MAESVPWLVLNKRYTEAEAILKEAARTNGVTLPAGLFDTQLLLEEKTFPEEDTHKKQKFEDEDTAKEEVNYGFVDIFRSKSLRKYALVMFLTWYVNLSDIYCFWEKENVNFPFNHY